jgi:hypothetical protein
MKHEVLSSVTFPITPLFHPSIIPRLIGGSYEEQKKDESFESSPQEKECQKITEKIEGGKKVPYLIR